MWFLVSGGCCGGLVYCCGRCILGSVFNGRCVVCFGGVWVGRFVFMACLGVCGVVVGY